MIYITGDMHAGLKKETARPKFIESLTSQDTLIVLGDFGYTWNKQILKEYNYEVPTFVIDGNHENYTILNECPNTPMLGGEVGVIKNRVYRLHTGEVYEFNGLKVFVFGGALSIDKDYRIPYVSWWPEEIPTMKEYNRALENLEKANWDIDLFLAHTCSEEVCKKFFNYPYKITDPTEKMISQLEAEIKSHNPNSDYKFLFGHHHSLRLSQKYISLYTETVRVNKNSEGINLDLVRYPYED